MEEIETLCKRVFIPDLEKKWRMARKKKWKLVGHTQTVAVTLTACLDLTNVRIAKNLAFNLYRTDKNSPYDWPNDFLDDEIDWASRTGTTSWLTNNVKETTLEERSYN